MAGSEQSSAGMEAAAAEMKEMRKRNDLLLIACSRGLYSDVEKLISMGASPSSRDKTGASALHFSASGGHLNVCKLLVNKGADVECEDSSGRTPLHLAASGDHKEVADWLLSKGAWVEAYDSSDDTPLHCAAKYASPDTARSLLRGGAKTGAVNAMSLTPIAIALLRGRIEVAKALEEGGASLSVRPRGYTLLHLVAASGGVEALRYLVSKGGNTNELSSNGLTPLHCAAMEGKLPEAEVLLKNGGDASVMSAEGVAAADMVPTTRTGVPAIHLETLQKLLKKAQSRPKQSGKAPNVAKSSAPKAQEGITPFGELPNEQQMSRVEAWIRGPKESISSHPGFNSETKARLLELKRMQEALDVHTCMLDLQQDADFQADAKVPRVLKAIEDVRVDPSKLKEYKDDGIVMGVIMKLKRFQDLLRAQGMTKSINLSDLVTKDASQLAATKRRQVALKIGCQRARLAAVSAARFVSAEQSREAAENVIKRQNPDAISDSAHPNHSTNDTNPPDRPDDEETGVVPFTMRTFLTSVLKLVICGIVSVVAARILAAHFTPQLEESLRNAAGEAAQQPQLPSQQPVTPQDLRGGAYDDQYREL